MKITFITGHLCKERHTLLNELALDLGEYGAEVTVLTGYPSRRISDEVRQYYLNHPIEQISQNVIVKRIGSKNGEGVGLFERMVKYLILTWQLYKEAKKTITDVYYLYSSPPFLGWIGANLAKAKPTLYNAQDLFPDTLLRIKGISENNLLTKILRRMEIITYKGNSKIVTISEDMRETIIKRFSSDYKVSVISNWADIKNLHHVGKDENQLLQELKVDKARFIISYAGDIGLFQGWSVILRAAKILQMTNPNVLFVIIGSGSYVNDVKNIIVDEKLENVLIFPLQSADRLSEIYSIGDLELVSIEPSLTKIALPSKINIIMSCGSPILLIADKESKIANIVNQCNLGYVVEPNNVEEIVNLVKNVVTSKTLNVKGENARRYAEENLDRKMQTWKYFEIVYNLYQEQNSDNNFTWG